MSRCSPGCKICGYVWDDFCLLWVSIASLMYWEAKINSVTEQRERAELRAASVIHGR